MDQALLFENIVKKHSFLCVGLDSEIEKIPSFLLKENDPVFEFNKRIIDATHKYTVAYKPNIHILKKTTLIYLLLLMQSEVILATHQKCMQKHFSKICLLTQ
jgi:orotidine-5'-phosphate decarboxylase